jgi:hypothetical protein
VKTEYLQQEAKCASPIQAPANKCGPASILLNLTREHAARLVGSVLASVSAQIGHVPSRSEDRGPHLPFECLVEPSQRIDSYILEFVRYGISSAESFLAALALLRRLRTRYPSFPFTPLTIHRLVAAALLVASKFTDDQHLLNIDFAHIAKLHVLELNDLELRFLSFLDYQVCVSPSELPVFDL